MKKRSFFGTHLYSQIVYPLLGAAVVVGLMAAAVAVYSVDNLTRDWTTGVVISATDHAAARAESYADQIVHETRLVAHEIRRLSDDDPADLTAIRVATQQVGAELGADKVLVLGPEGEALALAGTKDVEYGSKPLGPQGAFTPGRTKVLFTKLDGRFVVVALQSLPGSAKRSVAVAHEVGTRFVKAIGVSHDGVLGLYGSDAQPLGVAVGDGLAPADATAMTDEFTAPGPALRSLLRQAEEQGGQSGAIRVADEDYRVTVRRIIVDTRGGNGSTAYVVGAVGQSAAAEAGRATRNNIVIWSLGAILALVVLGRVVAKRVSDPLVELSSGARRIADGDFSTKVEVAGAVEVAELSESFNVMTDSLRERSDSLTKKVLELATLYEMSRALGATLDMDELLNSVLDSALRIFDLDLGYVVLRDKGTGGLAIRAIRMAGVADAGGAAVRSTMSEWVVREGRPLIFNPDTASGDAQIDAVTGARAALCVPLVSAEGTIGSVTIGSSEPGYRFDSDDVRLLSTIANHVTMAVGNIELFLSLQDAYLATVRSLATAVDAKDSYTRGHSDHVARYAMLIAERMGLSHDQLVALEMAAYLHDIGKIGVAEEILLKPGRLSDLEMEQMRHHPLIGANILKPVAFPWAINPVVRHHHESYDGNGYPAGLRGDEIPLLARILTVADSFEAMTADRPYRKGMSVAKAVEELQACSGSQFDPRVVDTFLGVVAELESTGEIHPVRAIDDVSPEEARAVFAALVDGVFESFRRLGGPRLASNVEAEVDAYFRDHGLGFRLRDGRLAFVTDAPEDAAAETVAMRTALRRVDATISRFSGGTLLDHFYSDALAGISEHMRTLAIELDFYRE